MPLLIMNRKTFKNSVLLAVILLSIVSFVTFTIYTPVHSGIEPHVKRNSKSKLASFVTQHVEYIEEKIKINNHNRSLYILQERNDIPERQTKKDNPNMFTSERDDLILGKPNYNVHIFYYPWYKNVKVDGHYAHWNHEYLPHWSDKSASPKKHHIPPDDIGANYYPQLGPYSSSDPVIIDAHMKQIRAAGPGVLCVSWYPPHYEGISETPVDNITMKLLDAASKYELKIAFHLEPYKNRDGQSLREVVKYIIDRYGNHSAFYRFEFKGRQLPVIYVYDSYQIKPHLWADALKEEGKFSIRNTAYDAIFLGLLVEPEHFSHLISSGFDGFYTYFASNGFVYGSTWANWPKISLEAKQRNLIFAPSIGPGYLDTRVRAWNGRNTKLRLNGKYYKSAFQSALAVKPVLLTITSFNEWHEGTQVESAVPKTITDFKYEDYQPHGPEFYLNLTRTFVEEYSKAIQPSELRNNL